MTNQQTKQVLAKLKDEVSSLKVNFEDRYWGKSEIEWGFETTHNVAIEKALQLISQAEKEGEV